MRSCGGEGVRGPAIFPVRTADRSAKLLRGVPLEAPSSTRFAMTTHTTLPLPLARRPRRSALRVGSALVLLGAMAVPFGGCLLADMGTAPDCQEGAIVDTSAQDCVKQVCKSEALVNEGDDSEIPDDGNPCTIDACSAGEAAHTVTMGSCVLGQSTGTCQNGECVISCSAENPNCDDGNPCTKNDCDVAAGKCAFSPDDSVRPDDGDDCTDDSCSGGKAQHPFAAAGTACGADDTGHCNANGACVGCVTDADCSPDKDCEDWACVNEVCTVTNRPAGTPLPNDKQTPGDCKNAVCDGNGGVMGEPNDGDVPSDEGKECTNQVCTGGTPMFPNTNAGDGCSNGGVCDGAGECVECLVSGDCDGGFTCAMNKCFSCDDGMKNGAETDVDCGVGCKKCTEGESCNVPDDCDYDVCNPDKKCGGCNDGIKNGAETDVDCGGDTCKDCNDGKVCEDNADCASNACFDGVCCDAVCDGNCLACNQPGKVGQCAPLPKFTDDTMPACSGDMTCNGGGSCKADNGQPCSNDGDCASNKCVNNSGKTCQP